MPFDGGGGKVEASCWNDWCILPMMRLKWRILVNLSFFSQNCSAKIDTRARASYSETRLHVQFSIRTLFSSTTPCHVAIEQWKRRRRDQCILSMKVVLLPIMHSWWSERAARCQCAPCLGYTRLVERNAVERSG